MAYEGPFDRENDKWLSERQRDIAAELSNSFIKPLYDSFIESEDSQETAIKINKLYDSLKQKGLDPKKYYLWSLLAPANPKDQTEYQFFDTESENGEIENFIRNEIKRPEEKSIDAEEQYGKDI